jgi:hypothetical protein
LGGGGGCVRGRTRALSWLLRVRCVSAACGLLSVSSLPLCPPLFAPVSACPCLSGQRLCASACPPLYPPVSVHPCLSVSVRLSLCVPMPSARALLRLSLAWPSKMAAYPGGHHSSRHPGRSSTVRLRGFPPLPPSLVCTCVLCPVPAAHARVRHLRLRDQRAARAGPPLGTPRALARSLARTPDRAFDRQALSHARPVPLPHRDGSQEPEPDCVAEGERAPREARRDLPIPTAPDSRAVPPPTPPAAYASRPRALGVRSATSCWRRSRTRARHAGPGSPSAARSCSPSSRTTSRSGRRRASSVTC